MRITIREIVLLAIEQLSMSVTTIKTLRNYKCGLGAFQKYCENSRIYEYSIAAGNDFIQKNRTLYENREISSSTWQLRRRCCEMLKALYEQGSVNIPLCQDWDFVNNPLRQKPSDETLSDSDNIFTITWNIKQIYIDLNLPKVVKRLEFDGFDRILRAHTAHGTTRYCPEITREIVREGRLTYESGKMCSSIWRNLHKASKLISEYHATGKIVYNRLPKYGKRELTPVFSKFLQAYIENAKDESRYQESTLVCIDNMIKHLLFAFEDSRVTDFYNITLQTITEIITHELRRYKSRTGKLLWCSRRFFKFLYKYGYTETDLSIAIPQTNPKRRVIREGFSGCEIEKMLSSLSAPNELAKRNKAIVLLASQTGLRACDIAVLKHSNIDWRNHEIKIIQQKTMKPLVMPLPIESGNAIADYLLNYRPKCDYEHLFISTNKPLRPIRNASVSTSIRRLAMSVGISASHTKGIGSHSFRKSFGKQLLESETSIDMLRELLGQSDMDSMKPYLAIDEDGLRDCALGLALNARETDRNEADIC